MTEVRAKLLNDLIEEGFEIVETEGTDKYWLIVKDKLSFVWPILISKVRKVTRGLINYEGENEETNEMEWFTYVSQDIAKQEMKYIQIKNMIFAVTILMVP